MVGDLAVRDAHDVDRLEMNLAMSWSDSKKWPLMSAVVRLVRSHSTAISKLPMDLRMKVREHNTKIGVEFSHTGFVGCRPRLRCVVDEIVSEEPEWVGEQPASEWAVTKQSSRGRFPATSSGRAFRAPRPMRLARAPKGLQLYSLSHRKPPESDAKASPRAVRLAPLGRWKAASVISMRTPTKPRNWGGMEDVRRKHTYEHATEQIAPPESAADVKRMLAETMAEVKAGSTHQGRKYRRLPWKCSIASV